MDDLKDRIRTFLREFKRIAVDRGIDVIPRRKTLDALSELGLTMRNCHDEILTLSVENYCSGPESDYDRPGEVWIFGEQIGDTSIYIKLKIAQVSSRKISKCLAFHSAEFPMCYPCREGGEEEKGGEGGEGGEG